MSAMAESFLEWGLNFAGRERTLLDDVFPLTSPIDDVPEECLASARGWWDSQGVADDSTTRVMFVGSHSRAFDFEPVREAALRAQQGQMQCEFVICGDGDMSGELRDKMRNLPNVRFPGWVDRPRLIALAERSSAALAPYRNTPDFQMSLPNKVIDALSLGLPILSPLHGEVASLIKDHAVGLSYNGNSGRTLHECIEMLANKPGLQSALSANAHASYAESFEFGMVYGRLVRHLARLADLGSGSGRHG